MYATAGIGQPTAESLFARAEGGDEPCDNIIECRFWDETRYAWRTTGVTTVALANGGVGCASTHLTDFIAVQVPSSFEGAIEFAQLTVEQNRTLQVRLVGCQLATRWHVAERRPFTCLDRRSVPATGVCVRRCARRPSAQSRKR